MGSPVDDALDWLEGCITRVRDGTIIVGRTSEEEADEALATVRSALEQLREERDAWKQRHIDSERDWRKEWLAREAAEAEVQRYREGLREIERGGVGGVRAFARALLADSPDGPKPEGGEA